MVPVPKIPLQLPYREKHAQSKLMGQGLAESSLGPFLMAAGLLSLFSWHPCGMAPLPRCWK